VKAKKAYLVIEEANAMARSEFGEIRNRENQKRRNGRSVENRNLMKKMKLYRMKKI